MSQQANSENSQRDKRATYLINAYINGSITPEEHDELDNWVGASDENMRAFEELTGRTKDQSKEESRKAYNRIWDELMHHLSGYNTKPA